MLPCVRRSYSGLVRLFAILSIFCALYYLFAELITILFSEASLLAYLNHTTIELLVPLNTVIEQQNSTLSPLSYTMRTVYLLQGCCFIPIYLLAATTVTSSRFRLLSVLAAILFSAGALLISSTQGGKYTQGGLYNLGFGITFLFGNLVMFLSGVAVQAASLRKFKWFSILAGLLGITAIATPFFIESAFTPLLERLSIYLLMIWEIALGFAVLRENR